VASSQHDIFSPIEIIVMGILADSYVLVVLRASLKGKKDSKMEARQSWNIFDSGVYGAP